MTDQVFDVDTPVPQGTALLVRFGDLRLERDDSLEPGYEVGHQAAPRAVCGGCGLWDSRRPPSTGRGDGTVRWTSAAGKLAASVPRSLTKDSRSETVTRVMPRSVGGHPPRPASAR